LINSVGYGLTLTGYPASVRVFSELQHHLVREERGGIAPLALFGTSAFWSVSAGMRMYFGGGPMRMGPDGVLDAVTAVQREATPEMTRVGRDAHHHGGH